MGAAKITGLLIAVWLTSSGICSRAQTDPPALPAVKPESKIKLTPAKSTGSSLMVPMILNYHPWHGLIVIDGLVNGTNPSQFIVSTGLTQSVVSIDDVARLQLSPSDRKVNVSILDTSAEAPTASIKSIRLGSGTLRDLDVARLNLINLISREQVPDAPSCWMGSNWLSKYQVTLDFESHAVILNRPEAPFLNSPSNIIPFKIKGGKPVVKVSVGNYGTFEAVVDTGSVGTLIPAAIAQKIKAKKADKSPTIGVDIASGKMSRMVLPSISLGKSQLKNLMVAYFGDKGAGGTDRTMGIIGLDFLRRFRIVISYAKSQIQILPLSSAPVPEPGL